MRRHDSLGRFTFAGQDKKYRHTRTIRVSDDDWYSLGLEANRRRITRADLLEEIIKNHLNHLGGLAANNKSASINKDELVGLAQKLIRGKKGAKIVACTLLEAVLGEQINLDSD